MTSKTSDETQRPYTVVFRDRDKHIGTWIETWHVLAANPKEAVGRAQAKALMQALVEGLDGTWLDLGLEVASVTEGHNAELLHSEVSPKKDREAIRAAMRAELGFEGCEDVCG